MQLHPTSLPSGRLDRDAYAFVDWLAAAGQRWWQVLPLGPPDRYGSPYKARSAFACWPRLLAQPRAAVTRAEELDFREREGGWVGEWERFSGRGALADQVRFDREWSALRAYAAERAVQLIGDVPIYVAPGSADHLAHPELFREDSVAGAPPDDYAPRGQLWGNPLYDWPALRRRGYRWWVDRLRRTFELFDMVRLDHFRGFVACWSVPAGAADARNGRWHRGPGRAVFDVAERSLGPLPVIAEDLGVITEPVHRLRDELGLPGMVVLQFGFDPDDPTSPHRLVNHLEHRVVYAGTHDNDTLRGWYESLDHERRALVHAALSAAGIRSRAVHWALIRLAASSPSRVFLVQAQDVLGLGSEARMNTPGRAAGAWKWKLRAGALTRDLAGRLREVAEESGRLSGPGGS